MLRFLKKAGIKEDTITTIEKIYSEANCFNLNSHESEIIKIIEYFKEIGIRNIDILLVEKLDVFYCSYEEVVEAFNEKGEDISVAAINYDYNMIDKIVFAQKYER